ncbi:nuclear transport factor 2 family protein [Frankia sp. Cr1]|uniref:nuclear transport factor 2 family protein n=1 Tax=Frankia sp. Cr1 TaxID=3073931 RepID=UPI002AD50DC6|nr:nuclear transport factor 2 family protein [Frankia sp. Cr1]
MLTEAADRTGRLGPGADLRARLADLSVRLKALQDLGEIEALHRSHTRAVSERRFGELADYFTDDAVADMRSHRPVAGRAAIERHFAGMAAAPLTGAGYVLSSPAVEVRADRAVGEWSWLRLYSEVRHGGSAVPEWGRWEEGRYHCEYRRTDAGWKFTYMHFRVVLPDRDPEWSDDEPTGKGAEQ